MKTVLSKPISINSNKILLVMCREKTENILYCDICKMSDLFIIEEFYTKRYSITEYPCGYISHP